MFVYNMSNRFIINNQCKVKAEIGIINSITQKEYIGLNQKNQYLYLDASSTINNTRSSL